MTPFHMIRAEEAPRRLETWPTAMKILACSTLAMFVAVVLLAWYAAGLQTHHRWQATTHEARCGSR